MVVPLTKTAQGFELRVVSDISTEIKSRQSLGMSCKDSNLYCGLITSFA